MNKYTILKNCHYNTSFLERLTTYSKNSMSGYIMLTESCWYDRIAIGSHINKLKGFSSDLFNKNSNRLGWRPSLVKNEFEIYVFKHIDGAYERGDMLSDDLICTLMANQETAFEIKPVEGEQAMEYSANFGSVKTPFPVSEMSDGWLMGFYFGGKPTAPQKMVAYSSYQK